jgi:ATP-dependent exoDNAse (exonuclease V) alpha subunit
MSEAQGIELARDFARGEFVDRGMITDLNVHWDMAEDGMPKPHAHVMLTMRAVDESGFGQKVREWNRTEIVQRWRERWAELANERLAELDIDARIDHRSLEAQGIALEPQSQIGAPAHRIEDRGIEGERVEADRAEMHREIARGNGARIPILGWTRSRISNRPSRATTWRSSRTATATGSTSSTRLWARCGARPIWSHSARTSGVKTASPPAT